MGMIDETQPGYDVTEGVSEQLTVSDTLSDERLDDFLDEGYNPPDREPTVRVPTESEEERGLSLDEQLRAETPDVWVSDENNLFGESGGEVGDVRAGRLVTDGSDAYADSRDDVLADDVGIDGAGASAEEAAMHVIDEYDQR